MQLIFKIAWRNILRHKGKSIIIGSILFIGSLLMTVGNGVISGMDAGLEKNIVNGFLGDIVIISEKEKTDNVMFKIMGESVESFSNFKDIRKTLADESYIKDMMPVGKNVSTIINEEEGDPGYTMVLGIDYSRYKKFFPDNFIILEGKSLKDDEPGVLFATKHQEDLYNQTGLWFQPEGIKIKAANITKEARENINNLTVKSSVVFLGLSNSNSTSDVRLPLKGTMKFRALNTFWGHFAIMDINSYRECLGYFTEQDMSAKIAPDKKKILAMDNSNLDAMFSSGSMMVQDTGRKDISGISFKRTAVKKITNEDRDAGTFNLAFVKLKDSATLDKSLGRINKKLKDANLGVRATTWKKASGFIGSMAVIIKRILFGFVSLLFLVAVIIIVNTLSMAAMERTTEIGMMRAIGAHKSFISGMFVGETAILSGFFGGFGILAGIIIVKIIPILKITSTNDLVQLIFGGDTFTPNLTFGDISVTLIQLFAVTLITIIYPVKIARSITPLDAISRD